MAFFLAGCGSSATATPTAVVEEVTLKVFAPSSMTDAAKELAASFEASNPNVKVVIEFGHSPPSACNLLKAQLEMYLSQPLRRIWMMPSQTQPSPQERPQ